MGTPCDRALQSKKAQPHQLVRTTFSKFTTCDHCGRILWGLIKQGFTCQTCGYTCHPLCISDVVELNCSNKALETSLEDLTPNIKGYKPNLKASHGEMLGLDEEHSGIIHKLINGESKSAPVVKALEENASATSTPSAASTASHVYSMEGSAQKKGYSSLKVTPKDHKKMISSLRRHASVDFGSADPEETNHSATPSTSSKISLNNFVRGVMLTRELQERELERARQNPSLNIMTTSMQNLAQFVPRITGVREFRDNAVKIFTWENPKRSWGVFFIYVLVCLRPIWLVILPFILMWISFAQDCFKDTSEPQSGSVKEKHDSKKNKKETFPIFSNIYPSIMGNDVTAARELAKEYTLNMQFLQNYMGTHVQIHESIKKWWIEFREHFGPSWPFWVTGIGFPLSLAAYHLLSLKVIFLLVGCYSLLGNNPYVMALAVNASSLLVDELNSHLNIGSLALKMRGISNSKFSGSSPAITINVFENQRWWAVLGWCDHMLSTERSAWTDETGRITQLPIFQQQPEPGYVWEEDSSWLIVRDWSLPVQADEGGWVYYSNLWSGPSAKPQINSFTRRRLWSRKMVPA